MANKGTQRNVKYSLTGIPIKMKMYYIDIILFLIILNVELSLLNLGSQFHYRSLSVECHLRVFFCKGTGRYDLGPAETHVLQE